MEALFLLIPLSVLIVAAATWVFLRMVNQGQFEDLDSPARRLLTDDDRPGLPSDPLGDPPVKPVSPRDS